MNSGDIPSLPIRFKQEPMSGWKAFTVCFTGAAFGLYMCIYPQSFVSYKEHSVHYIEIAGVTFFVFFSALCVLFSYAILKPGVLYTLTRQGIEFEDRPTLLWADMMDVKLVTATSVHSIEILLKDSAASDSNTDKWSHDSRTSVTIPPLSTEAESVILCECIKHYMSKPL